MKERRSNSSSKGKRNPLFYFFFIIFASAVIFGIVYYFAVKKPQDKRGEIYDELAEEVEKDTPTPVPTDTPVPTTSDSSTPTPGNTSTPTPVPVDIPVDFDKAWQTNEDIYAWIRIYDKSAEGIKYLMNYPILQSNGGLNDDYYLDHTVNNKKGLPGAIYSRRVNRRSFDDKITVIYGHNMANGTMFGVLNKFVAKRFADVNNEIVIYTPTNILTYEIFAGITYDNRLITSSFDVRSENGLEKFLDSLKATRNWNSYWRDGVTVTKEDRILVLSTCNGNKKQRFLLLAVLKDEQ